MCVLDGRFCITATDAADAVLRVSQSMIATLNPFT